MPNISTTNIFKICLLFLMMVVVNISMEAKQKSKEFVVVIDAGHGGKDEGAIEGKVVEKDINMGVAKYLEDYLKKKKIKVIMTRDGDKNVSLKERALKANKANADLFISLHANSLPEDNANRTKIEGANIFVLGNENTADHIESVKRENSVITEEKNYRSLYGDFDPEDEDAYEIFANVKRDNLTNSLGFAGLVKTEFEKAGRKFRGIHEAGFVVLKETNMPSVLIELDYMCNPNQAKYLYSTSGQKRLANSIANAVVSYRDALEKKGSKAFAATQETQSIGDVYVLPLRKSSAKRDDVAPGLDQSTGKQSSTLPRRRRSESSRRASSKRDLSTENIPDPTEYGNAVRAVTSDIVEENARDVAVEKDASQSTSKGKTTASTEKKKTKNESKAEEKSVKKKEEKRETKNSEEGEYRTYGNKKVLVKNVNSGSSSVVSLKSNKPASEKDASTARFQVPEDQEEPVAEPSREKKGSRFVDKAEAEAKAARADEKERIESEKRAEKARKDEMRRSEKEERRIRAEQESEEREMAKQQKKQDAADAKAQKAAEKKQRELAEKEQKEANKQHRLNAEQDKYNSGTSNHENNNKQYEAAKQKSVEKYETSSAPKSLKSKKKNK